MGYIEFTFSVRRLLHQHTHLQLSDTRLSCCSMSFAAPFTPCAEIF